jgi:D-glycero-D-manno-heptose 1,7-bisphosphate phosphatase
MSKALFLDRDGTLIVDKHYLADPDGVELLPGVVEGLRHARELGYRLFLFSNQSGVGRGYYTLDDALRVNERMEKMIGLPAPLFDGVCMATETPEQPLTYRKPSPRFITETLAHHTLDPRQCFMVGDRETDIEAGLAAGIGTAALANGKLDHAAWARFNFPGLALYNDFAAFAATLQ